MLLLLAGVLNALFVGVVIGWIKSRDTVAGRHFHNVGNINTMNPNSFLLPQVFTVHFWRHSCFIFKEP